MSTEILKVEKINHFIYRFVGKIQSATDSYAITLLIAGGTIIIGGILYLVIIIHERRKLNKMLEVEVACEGGPCN